jgi:TonB family protein
MKSPAGNPRARRPVQKKPVQLNLRRTPVWPEESDLERQPDGNFWGWFALVFFLHVIAFILLLIFFNHRPKPPVEFISLLPPGDTVKGYPGIQSAPKISPTQTAPSHVAQATPTPPPTPITPTPPQPKVQHLQPPTPKPPPIITDTAKTPAPPVKPRPPKPQPPKVKVDLTLANAPDSEQPAPAKPVKPKHHPKKPTHKPDDTPVAETDSETPGLSRDEVAQKLGDKLKASGVENAQKTGVDGSTHGKTNDFQDFYQSIHDQVMTKWSVPNFVDDTAIDPVVQIHVDKDGRVPAELVTLKRSSNNPAFDQSALEAARGMGHTLQPLPDGCPPDISITFNLHQQ